MTPERLALIRDARRLAEATRTAYHKALDAWDSSNPRDPALVAAAVAVSEAKEAWDTLAWKAIPELLDAVQTLQQRLADERAALLAALRGCRPHPEPSCPCRGCAAIDEARRRVECGGASSP